MDKTALDAYLARIGYVGSRTPSLGLLNALTLAHTQSIPFENLDVLMERPIDLSASGIVRKLVHDRRGGYCFEQNGLLLLALRALGFDATPLSARARLERKRSEIPPRTHLFVRVNLGGESWLTDVGVGGLSLTSAIRLEPDLEQITPHERRRIVRESGTYFHQALLGSAWCDVCEFTLEEMPAIDREVSNWYTSTHPASHFKGRLMVALAQSGGRRVTVRNNEFCLRDGGLSSNVQLIHSEDELHSILQDHFRLTVPRDERIARLLVQTGHVGDTLDRLTYP